TIYIYIMLTDLNSRGIEVQDADLGANITEDSELDPVIERSVLDQIDGVGLEKVDPIDGYGGHHLPGAVRLLVEPGDRGFPQRNPSVHDGKPGLAVLDPHLVGVDRREEHPNVERERRGGRVRVQIRVGRGGLGGGIGCGDAHVLNPNLLEIELGLLGLDGEEDDEDHGEDEESEEGEEEEEAAAAAAERGRGGRRRIRRWVVVLVVIVVVLWWWWWSGSVLVAVVVVVVTVGVGVGGGGRS
ncbi:hypothetical protein TorRG33x02_203090, partial [Trema orientale]